MAHAPVADGQRGHPQLPHHRANDARASEDHFGTLRLEADDRATRVRVARPVELDLPIDLGPVQGRTLDPAGSYVASSSITAVMFVTAKGYGGRSSWRQPEAARHLSGTYT